MYNLMCILRTLTRVILKNLKRCEKKLLQTGDIIKKLRIENKYTQTDLAKMLGLQLSTLQKYESGAIQNLKLETLRELCRIFSVPPIKFVFPHVLDKNKRKLLKWCISEYTNLNDDGIIKVLEYIEDINKKYAKR